MPRGTLAAPRPTRHREARRWRALPGGAASADHALFRWLRERGSLSALLRAHGSTLRVLRLRQGECAARALHGNVPFGPGALRVWLRDVLLELDGRPVVWARSVASPHCVRGAWRGLHGVGGRPLGDWLFVRGDVCRGCIEVRRLPRAHPLARQAWRAWLAHPMTRRGVAQPAPWARRSAFVRRGHALWVTEVFLPDALRLR